MGRKKNKNDFYRFLLQQNLSAEMLQNPQLMSALNSKINNDILIPRSILKKHVAAQKNKGGEGTFDFLDELEDLNNDNILYNEAVVGRQLDANDSLLRSGVGVDHVEAQYRLF